MTEQPRPRQTLLSVIIPTLNEEKVIGRTLQALSGESFTSTEVIVADGGSSDATTRIAERFGARVLSCERGRGQQLHSGAQHATGDTLLFVHADTRCPPQTPDLLAKALSDPAIIGGNFAIRFDGETRAARFMTWFYPQLGKIGLCYGDSGIFVRAAIYHELGGFKPIPLFEDVEFVQRLRKRGRMVHIPVAVVTSSRRFEERDFVWTFARWSILQALYWLGVSPRVLSQFY
ncbi:MAG: TIGR04283 family arsenosugar biosynthesis glycosyltransferase [Acidobacteria bacterium]|nr:TIGR04283 family arsenosugar biosynthesis glycosyltransferase [Acidobacteriota bacterium]